MRRGFGEGVWMRAEKSVWMVPWMLLGVSAVAAEPERLPGPFGIGSCHVNGRSVEDFQRWVPRTAEIGLRFHRSLASSWGSVEPEQGRWNWKDVDAQAAYLDQLGVRYGALLLGTPEWNKADTPGSLPVKNLDGWANYVSHLVSHLKGRVAFYEVWNEPPNFTGKDQTPEDYAKIVVAAYKAAKAADPDCQVGLTAKSAHINYLEKVIRAGAKDHFDWISLHPYEVLDGVVDHSGMEPVFLHIVPTLRKMLGDVNPAKRDVPVFFTELGCDAGRLGPEVQAQGVVKAYTMSIAQGVSCVQWFEGRDGDSGPMGLIDEQGKPRLAYQALGRLVEWLGQGPEYLGWHRFNGTEYGFLFKGAKGMVMVAWGPKGNTKSVTPSPETCNALTGGMTVGKELVLTETPVLIADPPRAWVELARANKSRPFPWGGDYSREKSVSISFGDTTAEKGLHSRAGDAVARAVVAYGGSARAGNVPGGNMFVVDPGFLSYDTVPIEITAEVRRKEGNENAGFKLVYESKDGFKTAGNWYTIPEEARWHTVRWRIDDPCFVNYWGYNFVLESDGPQYSNYYLRNVSVTRLDR